MQTNTLQVKVVLLGEPGVGKSSLMLRFVGSTFTADCKPTVGTSFMLRVMQVDGKKIKFHIWDTAGQERYHSLAKMYLHDADAAILVYDITNKASYEGLKRWHSELVEVAPEDIIVAIAGNKEDLVFMESVDITEVHEHAQSLGGFNKKVSCKSNQGIDDLFQELGHRIFNRIESPLKNQSFQLQTQKYETKEKKCC